MNKENKPSTKKKKDSEIIEYMDLNVLNFKSVHKYRNVLKREDLDNEFSKLSDDEFLYKAELLTMIKIINFTLLELAY